jgi:hypothetical protein
VLLHDAPDMGVPAPVSGVRTYAVPKTDHSFDYRTNTQAVAPLAFERDKEWVAVEKKIFNREF